MLCGCHELDFMEMYFDPCLNTCREMDTTLPRGLGTCCKNVFLVTSILGCTVSSSYVTCIIDCIMPLDGCFACQDDVDGNLILNTFTSIACCAKQAKVSSRYVQKFLNNIVQHSLAETQHLGSSAMVHLAQEWLSDWAGHHC